jgi:hypothetical protein
VSCQKYLKNRILLLRLQLIRTEQLQTTLSLLIAETVLATLQELEDIVDDNGL